MANVRKYILIPEYKPLYAMRKCYGPTHGPLTKPCPTPVDIIGELLKQKETVTVHEVKKIEEGVFSDPIQLTLDNYMKSYDEIVAGDNHTDNQGSVEEVATPVAAEVVTETVSEPEPEVVPEKETVQEDVITESVEEVVKTDSEKVIGAAEDIADEAPATEPAKRMSKAERRAARRNNQ